MEKIFTYTLVTCAIIITLLIVRKEFFLKNYEPDQNDELFRYIDNWELLVHNKSESETESVQLIEFIDYNCPYCRELNTTLQNISLSDTTLKMSRTRYYLPSGDEFSASWKAAIFAICTEEKDKFPAINSTLYESVQDKKLFQTQDLIQKFGLNSQEINNCMNDSKIYFDIKKAQSIARGYSIQLVPSLIINGKLVEGLVSEEVLKEELFNVKKNGF